MSIRRYLVLTLVAILTLITFVAAIQGYKASMARAEKLFEQQLIDFAHIVKGLNQTFNDKDKELVAIKQQTSFAFQVWQGQSLVLKSANSPSSPLINLQQSSTHFSEINFAGQRWQAIYLTEQVVNPIAKKLTTKPTQGLTSPLLEAKVNSPTVKNNQIVVIVAQPLKKQFLLAEEVILAAVTPMIISIVLLSILIYGVITQGLKPLKKLTAALANKQSNDFTPLVLHVDNSELSSVVTTLNQLFARLNLAFERERHFAADAAHELKTPLSVLKLNVHNLVQGLNELEQTSSSNLIKPLTVTVDRMGHVIDQILHLNRTNPEQTNQNQQKIQLKPLIQAVIADLYQAIAKKQQTITLVSDEIMLMGDELSLQLMLTNLISNANKYTPEHGEIKVSASQLKAVDKQRAQQKNTNEIAIIIEDSGKGIAKEEHHRVFDRFYRVGGDQHDSSVLGCGLGLTIVKHIVEMHRGDITLSQSTLLAGLQVKVVLGQNLTQEDSKTPPKMNDENQLNHKDERA